MNMMHLTKGKMTVRTKSPHAIDANIVHLMHALCAVAVDLCMLDESRRPPSSAG